MIELARNPSIQSKLREELTCQYRNDGDPTYDQFTSGLPYLDAVTHEVLRLHSGFWETIRVVRNYSPVIYEVALVDTNLSLGREG